MGKWALLTKPQKIGPPFFRLKMINKRVNKIRIADFILEIYVAVIRLNEKIIRFEVGAEV